MLYVETEVSFFEKMGPYEHEKIFSRDIKPVGRENFVFLCKMLPVYYLKSPARGIFRYRMIIIVKQKDSFLQEKIVLHFYTCDLVG